MKYVEYSEELTALRRHFHQNPELGFSEYETQKFVMNYLINIGLKPEKIAKTGVTAIIDGIENGKVLGLRTDMDALPVTEENEFDYISKNKGIMHACGHDGHLAIMLVAAKILSENREYIKGTIKLIFQPNEEEAGAEIMINEGVLKEPKVDNVIGMHLWTPIESGKVGISVGALMASSYYFKLTIIGEGGHGGEPHKAKSPILTGINIISAIQYMVANEFDAIEPTIVTVGMFNSGTFPIIIPEKAEIQGSVRCLHMNSEKVRNRINDICDNICKMHGVKYNLDFKCGNDVVYNDEEMTKIIKSAAEKIVGEENIITEGISAMVGEDFSEFCKEVPSSFIFIGTGNEEVGSNYPHHHPKFTIDEKTLHIGLGILVDSVKEYYKR